jgi:hypothetical protein
MQTGVGKLLQTHRRQEVDPCRPILPIQRGRGMYPTVCTALHSLMGCADGALNAVSCHHDSVKFRAAAQEFDSAAVFFAERISQRVENTTPWSIPEPWLYTVY